MLIIFIHCDSSYVVPYCHYLGCWSWFSRSPTVLFKCGSAHCYSLYTCYRLTALHTWVTVRRITNERDQRMKSNTEWWWEGYTRLLFRCDHSHSHSHLSLFLCRSYHRLSMLYMTLIIGTLEISIVLRHWRYSRYCDSSDVGSRALLLIGKSQ